MNSNNSSAEPPYQPESDELLAGSLGNKASNFEEQLLPIDQVAIRKLGGFNFLTIVEWDELPPKTQLRRIQREEVVFLSSGQEVPIRPALAYLKSIRAPEQSYEQRYKQGYGDGYNKPPQYPQASGSDDRRHE